MSWLSTFTFANVEQRLKFPIICQERPHFEALTKHNLQVQMHQLVCCVLSLNWAERFIAFAVLSWYYIVAMLVSISHVSVILNSWRACRRSLDVNGVASIADVHKVCGRSCTCSEYIRFYYVALTKDKAYFSICCMLAAHLITLVPSCEVKLPVALRVRPLHCTQKHSSCH